MSTKELKRLSVIEKVIKKINPSDSFRTFRANGQANKAFSKKV